MTGTTLIRASAMMGIPETIRELGGDPKSLLGQFNLREDLINNPKQMMPYSNLTQLMEQAARELDCKDFGLRVGLRQGMGVLGPIAVIAQNSSNTEQALRHIIKYMAYHSPGVRLALDPVIPGNVATLHFDIALEQAPIRSQTVELSLVLAKQVIGVLAGPGFRPTQIRFRHARQARAARYRSIFQCPVHFNRPGNALCLSADDLQRPIEQSDAVLRQVMEDYVRQTLAQTSASLSANVRSLVISLLPMGQRCTISLVARHLALHERTLQRALKREGVVFEELVDDIRRELTSDYLSEPGMAMSQVAGLLGYRQQSSFNRACFRWFGQSPRAMRDSLTSGDKNLS
ncbi:AraC family transcriptional regulator [Marinobacter sp. M216]|uniref:AraC family transcriptional regulator n=1 Tax=Marinobacter albus TaxID=3030833 RepID=A0ABT7HED5_9GAMM|nr:MULTISPECIES: AraC family transcriptional regulator [unclassified Marinobacter]MBW7472152.1 AraC family transcriptional regulator [Marinobacter sp. F4218]MDK9558722.1 AraC family transcriptional regulator [Marinobacter sp. M216]